MMPMMRPACWKQQLLWWRRSRAVPFPPGGRTRPRPVLTQQRISFTPLFGRVVVGRGMHCAAHACPLKTVRTVVPPPPTHLHPNSSPPLFPPPPRWAHTRAGALRPPSPLFICFSNLLLLLTVS